jgi:hypothetical protein
MGFLDLMFGCPHKRFSFPISIRGARRRFGHRYLCGVPGVRPGIFLRLQRNEGGSHAVRDRYYRRRTIAESRVIGSGSAVSGCPASILVVITLR